MLKQPKKIFEIFLSHKDDIKLLGTTQLKSGSGLNQANAMKGLLDEWNIQEKCLAICFDTTVSNTGKFSRVCILLQAILGHLLLWAACRHHVPKIALCYAAKIVFEISVGPKSECFYLHGQKQTLLS